MAIQEKALGPEHPDVARTLITLFGLYYEQFNFAQAEPLGQRALAILEKEPGPQHPAVIEGLRLQKMVYIFLGKDAEEELILRRL